MDYLRGGSICWEEQGTFVYEVLEDDVSVRTHPAVNEHYKTDIRFQKADLVAIDLVRPSRSPSDGPYLRLSDGCGWLLEQEDMKPALTRRSAETGLWTFYVDNFPLGQALIRHPVANRLDLMVNAQATYSPMRKVYCDRRVVSSTKVEFFRVQGTKGWIVGRGLLNSKKRASSMLLPEEKVKSGVFGYICHRDVAVHTRPSRRETFKTPLIIEPNQLLVANLVREAPVKGGTFARLIDGSGWLPIDDKEALEAVPVVHGSWTVQIVSITPVQLLRQPMDRSDMIYESKTTYKLNSEVECDQRIAGWDGVAFYSVKGTNGYLQDRRGADVLLQLVERFDDSEENGWTPDFVRGIASLVSGVYESGHDQEAKMLSFSASGEGQPVIDVYYATRIVGSSTRSVGSSTGVSPLRRDCSPTDVAEILRDPAELNSDDGKPAARVMDCNNPERVVEEQEETLFRQKLVECYNKSEKLKMQQLKILRVLKRCDDRRGESERALAKRSSKRAEELQQLELERMKEEQFRNKCTCEECGSLFKDPRAKQKHFQFVHGHKCHTCGSTFASFLDLVEHQDDTDHGTGLIEISASSRLTCQTSSSSSFDEQVSQHSGNSFDM